MVELDGRRMGLEQEENDGWGRLWAAGPASGGAGRSAVSLILPPPCFLLMSCPPAQLRCPAQLSSACQAQLNLLSHLPPALSHRPPAEAPSPPTPSGTPAAAAVPPFLPQASPICHGPTTPATLLHDVAGVVRRNFVERANSLQFALLALAPADEA